MITALILLSQVNGKLVTIDLPVCPVERVLEDVARQTNTKFAVLGAVREDFVFVSVKNINSNVLLTRLEKLLDAKWVNVDGVRTLTSVDTGESDSDRSYQRNVDLWVANLKKQMNDRPDWSKTARSLLDAEKKLSSDDPKVWDDLHTLDSELPITRFLNRLLVQLAPQIKKIKNNSRAVFSLNPTSLQGQIPAEGVKICTDFQAEYLQFRDLISASPMLDPKPGQPGLASPALDYRSPKAPRNFSISVSRVRDSANTRLHFWDEEGNIFLRSNGGMWEVFDQIQEEADKSNPFIELKQKIVRPKSADRYLPMQIALIGRPSPGFSKFKPEIADLIDFSKNEPLADIPTDVLRQYQRLIKKNVIAYVPDSSIQNFYNVLGPDGESQPDFATALPLFLRSSYFGTPSLEVNDEDGLLSIRDRFLGQARLLRMPRKETSSFLKQVMASQSLDLDAFADYLKVIKHEDCLTVTSLYVSMAAMKKVRIPTNNQIDLIRFYGEFPRDARDRMKSIQHSVQVQLLNPTQRNLMIRMLINDEDSLVDPSVQASEVSAFGIPSEFRFGRSLGNIQFEPTVALARGFPSGSICNISLSEVSDLCFVMGDKGNMSAPRSISINDAAQAIYNAEKGTQLDYYNQPRQYSVQPTKLLKVDLFLPNLAQARKFLTVSEVPFEQKWLTIDELPDNVKSALTSELEKVRLQNRNLPLSNTQGGRSVKPPQ